MIISVYVQFCLSKYSSANFPYSWQIRENSSSKPPGFECKVPVFVINSRVFNSKLPVFVTDSGVFQCELRPVFAIINSQLFVMDSRVTMQVFECKLPVFVMNSQVFQCGLAVFETNSQYSSAASSEISTCGEPVSNYPPIHPSRKRRWDFLSIKSTSMSPNQLRASSVHINLTAGKKEEDLRSPPRTS